MKPLDSVAREGVLYLSLPGLAVWLSEYADRLRTRPLDERSDDDGETVLDLITAELLSMDLLYNKSDRS